MAERICQICREDCSDRPRIKDPKGRYFCRACYDGAVAAKNTKAAVLSAPPDDGRSAFGMDEIHAAEPAPMTSPAVSTWNARTTSESRASDQPGWSKPILYSLALGGIWFMGGLLGLLLERPFVLFFFAIIGSLYYFAFRVWILIAAGRERGVVEVVLCLLVPLWWLVFSFFRSESRSLKAGFIPLLAVFPVFVMWVYQAAESQHRTLDPWSMTGQTYSAAYSADLNDAIRDARWNIAAFRDAFLADDRPGTFYVRGYIDFDPDGPPPAITDDMVWIELTDVRDDGLWIGTVPWRDEVYAVGTTVTLHVDAVTDVMIVTGNKAAGGFTLVVERDYLLPDQRRAWGMRHPYRFVGF